MPNLPRGFPSKGQKEVGYSRQSILRLDANRCERPAYHYVKGIGSLYNSLIVHFTAHPYKRNLLINKPLTILSGTLTIVCVQVEHLNGQVSTHVFPTIFYSNDLIFDPFCVNDCSGHRPGKGYSARRGYCFVQYKRKAWPRSR